MFDARRLTRRLFYLALILIASVTWAQGPALTTINDTVDRADGTPAGGTLLISWPEFSTAAGQAVAAGSKAVTLGSNGLLTVQLAPNVGAIPANTLFTVVYQLSEKNDIKRGVYDRLINAVISVAVSAAIAWHGRWGLR
jgi:hypothetical protein